MESSIFIPNVSFLKKPNLFDNETKENLTLVHKTIIHMTFDQQAQ